MTARPCSRATAAWCAIASSSASSSARERRVAIADELADLPPLPAQREPHGVGAGAAFRPRDLPVLEHERGARRMQTTPSSSSRSPRATPRDRATRTPPPRSARAPRARRHDVAPARRASRARSSARPATAMATSSSISASVNARGSRVRTLSAPSSVSRARIGTARIDSYSSSGRFGNCLKRGSRCACAAIITGARSAAAIPVIPSPGRMRGVRVSSSTRVPCVARSTSSSARSS